MGEQLHYKQQITIITEHGDRCAAGNTVTDDDSMHAEYRGDIQRRLLGCIKLQRNMHFIFVDFVNSGKNHKLKC
jgi:hypothetical protein